MINLSRQDIIRSLLYTFGILLFIGITTSLIPNPIFMRKIDVLPLDYVIFVPYAVLLGFYLGIPTTVCSTKASWFGGLFGFLGFACPTCNAILLMTFGPSVLLTYFEPIRHLVGFIGLAVLAYVLYKKLFPSSSQKI